MKKESPCRMFTFYSSMVLNKQNIRSQRSDFIMSCRPPKISRPLSRIMKNPETVQSFLQMPGKKSVLSGACKPYCAASPMSFALILVP